MSDQASLVTVDYVVAAIILLVPVAIGIWYAVKDANRATRAEYLLGGRQMSVLPVALSTFITFQSAISLIGYPSETFYYGSIYVIAGFGLAISYVVGCFTIVPLMYPLHITSIYEYLQLRYNSEAVRMVSTVVGMLGTVCYMAIALLSPALALEASADLPLWMSIAVFGAVGTLYTSIGGIKSVIWTDAFQTVVVFTGIFAMIVKACVEVGGVEEAWRLSQAGGRLRLDKFSPDPRVRHTVWSLLLGMCFMWLVNSFNQSTLQRISSMKSLRDAKTAYLLNIPLTIVYAFILTGVGVAIFAYYSYHRCDPYEAGLISNRNQLAAYFVLHAMADMPGMAGLYISILCCGALSTLSSGINALAANTVEDILQRPLHSLRESTITLITKVFVVLYGTLIIGLAYLAKSMKGPVHQMAGSVFGSLGSPILGIFLMGGAVPWANKVGALSGATVAFAFNLWVSVGGRMHGTPITPLPSPGSEGCFANSSALQSVTAQDVLYNYLANSTVWRDNNTIYKITTDMTQQMTTTSYPNPPFFLYDISYEWYSLLGTIVCVMVGLSVSYVTNRICGGSGISSSTDARYIFPFLRQFWGMKNPDVPCYTMAKVEISVQNGARKQ